MYNAIWIKRRKLLYTSVFMAIFSLFCFQEAFTTQVPQNLERRVNYFSYLGEALHIIKEYYVDKSLINNEGILKHVIKTIKEDGKIKTLKLEKIASGYEFKTEKNRVLLEEKIPTADLIATLQLIAFEYSKKTPKAPPKKAYEFILKTIMDYLDPHSTFLSVSDFEDLIEGTEGLFGGLGIVVSLEKDHILSIMKVIPNSPAFKAGLKKGDKIVGIEGRSTFGDSLDDLVSKMKGAPGTFINLTLLGLKALKTHEIKIKRDIIILDSVEHLVKSSQGKNYLYLKIKNFASRASKEIISAIKKTRKAEKKLSGIILDLRGNPGGLLSQAVKVSDLFLDSGIIVGTKGITNDVESAEPKNDLCKTCPIITLIGAESASASEIVSAALQDNKRSLIIGQNSFGKSTVQTLFELQTKEAIKLTIARYYRPKGSSLQNIGVTPDLMVQALHLEKENKNIFGSYRYSREKFLDHVALSKKGIQTPFSPYNMYYISKEKEDYLVVLAQKILEESQKNWKQANKNSNVTINSHEVFEKNKEIKKIITSKNKESSHELQKKYTLAWNSDHTYKNTKASLKLSVKIKKSNQKKLEPGSHIILQYKIENTSKENAERVSLFVRDSTYNLSIEEKLIGKVKAKNSVTGELKLLVPQVAEEKEYEFQLGLALDGISQLKSIQKTHFTVSKTPDISFETSVTLSDEKGGKIKGTLEPLEKANLSIEIQNKSSHKTKEVTLKIVNLSGKQISIHNAEKKIKSLAPFEKRKVRVQIEGSKNLLQKELTLGLSVFSYSSDKPKRYSINIKAAPQ